MNTQNFRDVTSALPDIWVLEFQGLLGTQDWEGFIIIKCSAFNADPPKIDEVPFKKSK